jgi:hypothetical protein
VEAPDEDIELNQVQLNRVPKLVTRLRQHQPEEHRSVSGWVRTASADELAKAGHPTGLVIVEAKVEGRMRNVLVNLPSELFERARPGTSQIWAKGTLQKIGNRWHLSDPRDIQIRDVASPGPKDEG